MPQVLFNADGDYFRSNDTSRKIFKMQFFWNMIRKLKVHLLR